MSYVIGVDCGGTFTDCVIIDDQGNVTVDKAVTTPDDLTLGILEAIANAGRQWAETEEKILQEANLVAIGTTAITNRLVGRKGAKVGLITTKGHEDAIFVGRVFAKSMGLDEDQKRDIRAWKKPEPLVPKSLVRPITERIDYKGAVIVSLNQEEVIEAVHDLVSQDVEAIAVSFLWSFANNNHEREVLRIIRSLYPDLFVTLSSDVAPILGEYERTMTTILNGYLGPASVGDMATMRGKFSEKGYQRPLYVMQSNGGMVGVEKTAANAVSLLASGPVGGVMGAVTLGNLLNLPNIITTDMGGTSFDVGLVVAGEAPFLRTNIYDRYPSLVPSIGVTSIGAGGGSLVRVDTRTGSLSVGPDSAGAMPGPVCYGRGGTIPTVTDADLVLGRLSAERFFAGRERLDIQAALESIEKNVAAFLGCTAVEAASGIAEVVDGRMADLIRKATLERGHEPRDFALLAYGGAGPMHIGAVAQELGIRQVVVPTAASVFSAFGIATSEARFFYSLSRPMRPPFDVKALRRGFDELVGLANEDLRRGQFEHHERAVLSRYIDMRFRNQIHEVSVPVYEEFEDEKDAETLSARFINLYETGFGTGSAYMPAGLELLTLRLLCQVPVTTEPFAPRRISRSNKEPSRTEPQKTRQVYFQTEFVDTPVVSWEEVSSGEELLGPALIEGDTTTMVIHPGQKVVVDDWGNLVLHVG